MFTYLETLLISFGKILPLEAFVFVASIVEEIIAPIPSPTIMLLSGSLAQLQERTLYMLIPLALIGACGKTLGALLVYFVSDRFEDFAMSRFGHFFNVSHADIETFGKKLGNGKRDYLFLTTLRALPFIPSVFLSVGLGVLKIPLPLFITSTFLGTIIRDGFYLYAGFMGTEVLSKFIAQSTHVETYIEIAGVTAVLAILTRLYFMRRKAHLRK
jgi:membrane protein DedA with SNARE-associated domain